MKRLRILIVDDEEPIRALLTRVFSETHHTETARDGWEAQKLAEESSYDLAFIDMRMPGMDGFETFLALKEQNPDIAGVIITGHADEVLIRSAIREGVVSCLRKPFNIQDVKDIAEAVAQGIAGRAVGG